MYKPDNLKHNNSHISEILISEFLYKKSTKKEIYIVFINKKIIITVKERKKLLFYNQFEYKGREYIKYILLVMNEYKIEIDRTSVEKISNAKISAEDLIKEAKNKSILKIEESRKDLSSAKILNKIKELSVDEIKSGSDDISKKIREISLIIKDRTR